MKSNPKGLWQTKNKEIIKDKQHACCGQATKQLTKRMHKITTRCNAHEAILKQSMQNKTNQCMIKYPCDKAMTIPKSATYHKGCQMIKELRLKHKTNIIHTSEKYHRTKESCIKGQTRNV